MMYRSIFRVVPAMAVEIHKFGRHYLGSAFLIVIFVYNYKQKNNLPAINRGYSWQVNIIRAVSWQLNHLEEFLRNLNF